jgi:hypothetical protein
MSEDLAIRVEMSQPLAIRVVSDRELLAIKVERETQVQVNKILTEVRRFEAIGDNYTGNAAPKYTALVGVLDGNNKIFTLPADQVFVANTAVVYLDGQRITDFTPLDDNDGVQFDNVPGDDSCIHIDCEILP